MRAALVGRARLRSGYAEQDGAAQHEPLLARVDAPGLGRHGPVVRRDELEYVDPLGGRLVEKRGEQSGCLGAGLDTACFDHRIDEPGAGVECAEAEPALVTGRLSDQLR